MRTLPFLLVLGSQSLFGNPIHSKTVAGEAILSGSDPLLEITTSDKAIIEWKRFCIEKGETVRFLQPSKDSVVLNRVVGVDLSEILGNLEANGRLFLINPRGIIVGEGAKIDTASFLGSTLEGSDTAFLAGQDFLLQGDSTASIVQLGKISARDYDIVLIAHQIEQKGQLSAPQGTVSLLAAHEVLLKPKSCPLLQIRTDLKALGVENAGTIEALRAQIQTDSSQSPALSQKGTIHLVEENGEILFFSSQGAIEITQEASLIAPHGQVAVRIPESTEAKPFYHMGHIEAPLAGTIAIDVPRFIHAGTLSAEGGTISLQIGQTMIETSLASLSVNAGGQAGSISVHAPHLFTSGTYQADGQTGGTIHLLGDQIQVVSSQISAKGSETGGTILIGGDYQGNNPEIPNAKSICLNRFSSIQADGGETGGKIVLWSDEKTENYASISASGLQGGFVEISSKQELLQRGEAVAKGENGKVLFDPKNITIDATTGTYPYFDLVDPTAGSGSGFGSTVVVLTNGNIVVTKPQDATGGTDAGAVYLYNGFTGALISTITGSNVSDQVGSSGVTQLTGSSAYVIRSSSWNSSRGAATYGNGTTGVSGVVSASNSLIGSTAGDAVSGSSVAALTNGNYVVCSSGWNIPAGNTSVGAATWGNGTTGITGTVSVANSLIGTLTNDNVGVTGVTALSNGNYVVGSANWNAAIGAATWGNGTTGITGSVSVANSLIGSTAGDAVSANSSDVTLSGIVALTNGNYVVGSYTWNDPAGNTQVGAATFGNGTTGITGTVSVTNSLIGTFASDWVSDFGIAALTNGNYVVSSGEWNGTIGAVTFGNGTTGITGTVSVTNSLIGSTPGDFVGGVSPLTNGNYVGFNFNWNGNIGAVTFGNGTTGITGTVSIANSLVGSGTAKISGGTLLTNGNYVVLTSPSRFATFGNGTTGITGTPSIANSLFGPTGVVALSNGNYVCYRSGAVTWSDGTTGITGTASIANSVVSATNAAVAAGTFNNDPVFALTNGNYVIKSPSWGTNFQGAFTLCTGTGPITGTVSSANSFVGGTAIQRVGYLGSSALADGNYVIVSNQRFDVSDFQNYYTWGNGLGRITGTPSAANSMYGDHVAIFNLPNIKDNTTATGTYLVIEGGAIHVALSQDAQYAQIPATDITLPPSFLTNALAGSSTVDLNANNDITISSPVTYQGGTLNIGAGRTVTIDQSITTGGGNLSVVANAPLAAGVVDADRDAGEAFLYVNSGVTVNSGGGNISLTISDGAGKTNAQSGDILIASTSTLTSGAGSISLTATDRDLYLANTASVTSTTGNIDLTAGGTIYIGSATISATSGAITAHSPVRLTASPTSFVTTSGGNITFSNTVDGAFAFSPNASTGILRFQGAVGDTTPLSSLTATGSTVRLSGNVHTTANTLLFASPVVLDNSLSLTDDGSGITFQDTVTGAAYDLTLSATAGQITGQGAISTKSLTSTSGNNSTFDGAITTDLNTSITSNSGSVTVAAVTSTNGSISLQPSTTEIPNSLSPGDVMPQGILVLKGALQASNGTVSLSPAGRTQVLSVATITGNPAGGNVNITANALTIGNYEALTVFGDVQCTITGASQFGTIVATGSLDIQSGSNQIFRVQPGDIYNASGTLYQVNETNLLATTALPTLTPTPTYSGSGATPNIQKVDLTPSAFEAILTYSGYLLTSGPYVPPSPTPTPTSIPSFAPARTAIQRALAESFENWDLRSWGPYLSEDCFSPAYTAKGLFFVLPSLANAPDKQETTQIVFKKKGRNR